MAQEGSCAIGYASRPEGDTSYMSITADKYQGLFLDPGIVYVHVYVN